MIDPSTPSFGIPIEAYLSALGALVWAVYTGIVREVRKIGDKGEKRDAKVLGLTIMVKQICEKLGIHYTDGE